MAKEGFYLFEDVYKAGNGKHKYPAIHFKGVDYSYEEIRKSVDYLCQQLTKMGVKKDDHVALLSLNGYNWLIAYFAIIKVGAVAVLLNYMGRHNTLVDALRSTDCHYLCAGRYSAFIKDETEFPRLQKDAEIPPERTLLIDEGNLNFKEILPKAKVEPFVSPYPRKQDSKRTSFIIFTTGTSAKPKACMLSQYGLMNLIYINLCRLDPVFPRKFMCLLPLFHSFGLLVTIGYLAYKRTVYLSALDDKREIYREFTKNKCGDYAGIAIVFDKLARAPLWWLHRGRFVKHCILGGGFTSEYEMAFLERKYGKNKFLNGYGQTECSPLISLVYPDAPKEKQRTTVGTPMEGIELAFMDPNTKEMLPNGEKGEILVKGYNVFNGYYNLPKESQPFDENGYLHTGDLGYLDKDGYLVLTGRIKDIIIRKGENISPKEIEAELRKFPEFGNVRVLGFPSPDEGEYIIACVELLKKPPHFSEKKYFEELRKTLPSVKIPTHIIYMKRFPLSANGKIDEVVLREVCMRKMTVFLDDKPLAMRTRKLMNR